MTLKDHIVYECTKQCTVLSSSFPPALPVQRTHEIVVDADDAFWQTRPLWLMKGMFARIKRYQHPWQQLRESAAVEQLERRDVRSPDHCFVHSNNFWHKGNPCKIKVPESCWPRYTIAFSLLKASRHGLSMLLILGKTKHERPSTNGLAKQALYSHSSSTMLFFFSGVSFTVFKQLHLSNRIFTDLDNMSLTTLLIWVFGHFWLFLHHGIQEVERDFLWKFHKKIQRKCWSNVPPKLLACIGFLYKVVHKIGRLRKFNRAREIEFNFLSLGLSLWNLAHLFIMFMATRYCLIFF